MAPTVSEESSAVRPTMGTRTSSSTAAAIIDRRRVRRIRMKSIGRMKMVSGGAENAKNRKPEVKESPEIVEKNKSDVQIRDFRDTHMLQELTGCCSGGKANVHRELLDIALRILNLMQRNRILQRELSQLKVDTRKFVSSVMENPENRKKLTKSSLRAEFDSRP